MSKSILLNQQLALDLFEALSAKTTRRIKFTAEDIQVLINTVGRMSQLSPRETVFNGYQINEYKIPTDFMAFFLPKFSLTGDVTEINLTQNPIDEDLKDTKVATPSEILLISERIYGGFFKQPEYTVVSNDKLNHKVLSDAANQVTIEDCVTNKYQKGLWPVSLTFEFQDSIYAGQRLESVLTEFIHDFASKITSK